MIRAGYIVFIVKRYTDKYKTNFIFNIKVTSILSAKYSNYNSITENKIFS